MWLTPPIVAGALGWKGVWGSGSAFLDYLIPIPVAGGVLHVPSFIVALLAVRAYGGLSEKGAAIVRGVFLGFALLGLAILIDVERLYLEATTDLSFTRIGWQQNPLGLFILSDSLWVFASMVRVPPLRTRLGPAVAATLLLPSMYLWVAVSGNTRLVDPFVRGQSLGRPERGDEIRWVYARLSFTDPTFRSAALAWIAAMRPETSVNDEDVAFFFTDSLDAATGVGTAVAATTLCVYEDGTPDRWQNGEADCFSEHVSFSDRVAAIGARVPRDMPGDVRRYLSALSLCGSVVRSDPFQDGLADQAFCRQFDLQPMQQALEAEYGTEQLAIWISRFDLICRPCWPWA